MNNQCLACAGRTVHLSWCSKSMQFHLKTPIPQKISTNKIYAGMHFRSRKKIVDLYHNYFIDQKGKTIEHYPVDITYIFTFKTRPLDSLNTAFMAKMIEDSLIKHGVLQDDTPEFVESSTLISKKGEKDEVEIIIP